jgi:hypothetical protein
MPNKLELGISLNSKLSDYYKSGLFFRRFMSKDLFSIKR